ncbi:hypothetical protein [Sulfuracidifex metallicus]|uniref:hypothetical protein n=1 Tax=Sulfuracidifex metallicus TaxID=47303 RepID=UPI0006D23009|nr:hypothetical protein [Sulfuracidifex metallicus]
MGSLDEKLWEILNNMIPLFQDDIDTFLVKEGYLTEEDVKKWNDIVKLIKEAYKKSFSSPNECLEKVKNATELLSSISTKTSTARDENQTRGDKGVSLFFTSAGS